MKPVGLQGPQTRAFSTLFAAVAVANSLKLGDFVNGKKYNCKEIPFDPQPKGGPADHPGAR
jgi:hypothetical protein